MAKKKTNTKWFMEQVENEQSGLKGFIRMLGVRPESVDDIAQETFVVAYKKLTMFERGTNFGAWLRTIARNLVRNELRRQGRRRLPRAGSGPTALADRAKLRREQSPSTA